MNSHKKIGPPNETEFREAMMLVFGALPEGADIHYFWKDGAQHMTVTLEGGQPTTYKLNRSEDGSGVVVPTLH